MTWLFTLSAALVSLTFAQPATPDSTEVERAIAAVQARAEKGDLIAQFSLASLLYYGRDQTDQSVAWFRKAAAQRYAPAEYQLGQLYDFGFGVAQDDREALAWYRKAAEHGSAAAQRAIGDFYQKGRGVPMDPAEAAQWYRRGADGDDIRAQYQLGNLYFTGTGVPQDYAAAFVWFSLAASQAPLEDNRKGLLELRNIAAVRMPAAAVADAHRRVAAWKPTVPR